MSNSSISNDYAPAQTLLYILERAAAGIGLQVNAHESGER